MAHSGIIGSDDRAVCTLALLRRAALLNDLARRPLCSEIVRVNLGIAVSIAHRFRGCGLPESELERVAAYALAVVAHDFRTTDDHEFLCAVVRAVAVCIVQRVRQMDGSTRASEDVGSEDAMSVDTQRMSDDRRIQRLRYLGRCPTQTIARLLGLDNDTVAKSLHHFETRLVAQVTADFANGSQEALAAHG